MVLVGYSDSEGSDTEDPKPVPTASKPTPASKSSNNFTIDKANPSKIRVNLSSSIPQNPSDREDGEPAAKRARIGGGGGGAFSGFNAMLPAPKRDNEKLAPTSTNGNKAPARKVFSLKTGAEPAFSRESDAEMKTFFAEQEQERAHDIGRSQQEDYWMDTIPSEIPKPSFVTESKPSQTVGKPFMFKPLSVSRGPKKKKPISQIAKGVNLPVERSSKVSPTVTEAAAEYHTEDTPKSAPSSKPKISLFSSGPAELPPDPDSEYNQEDEEDEIVELLDDDASAYGNHGNNLHPPVSNQPESLTSIAESLNLNPAERRRLLGRKAYNSSSTSNDNSHKIITFNTDTEYATNQVLNASADASAQHNPVRAIAGGKHSLKQLVANAQGQKEALEESFAMGRRNKREAGTKYGW